MAQKVTISLLEEEIEYLRKLLDEERDRSAPKFEIRGPVKEFTGQITKSRIPWSRKQAELEGASAKEAAEIERAAWAARVAKVSDATWSEPVDKSEPVE